MQTNVRYYSDNLEILRTHVPRLSPSGKIADWMQRLLERGKRDEPQ